MLKQNASGVWVPAYARTTCYSLRPDSLCYFTT
jgi:hypothetical protein